METYTSYKSIICGKVLIVAVVILLLHLGVYMWKQNLESFVESNFPAFVGIADLVPQMMTWFILHPLMEQLVILTWKLEFHQLC